MIFLGVDPLVSRRSCIADTISAAIFIGFTSRTILLDIFLGAIFLFRTILSIKFLTRNHPPGKWNSNLEFYNVVASEYRTARETENLTISSWKGRLFTRSYVSTGVLKLHRCYRKTSFIDGMS